MNRRMTKPKKRQQRQEQAISAIKSLNKSGGSWGMPDLAKALGIGQPQTHALVGSLLRSGRVEMRDVKVTVSLPCVVEGR